MGTCNWCGSEEEFDDSGIYERYECGTTYDCFRVPRWQQSDECKRRLAGDEAADSQETRDA